MSVENGEISVPPGLTLITGGARSGKSSLAQRLGQAWSGSVYFIATGYAGDEDMAMRIEQHQLERPDHWITVEAPLEVRSAAADVPTEALLILDCLTMWGSNTLLSGTGIAEAEQEALLLGGQLANRRAPTIVVTNEVGLGIVPDNEMARQYRDMLGRMNQAIAHNAQQTLFISSGKITLLKNIEDVL